MKTLDLRKYGRQRVSFYLALEKFLLNSEEWRERELFFIWDIFPAIVCGKHQLIASEVNMEHARRNGVPVYRRHSGGGTIFADEGCFMFTFIRRSQCRDEVFRDSLSHIVSAFSQIGLDTELSGRNDLMFRGKKFSGNAYFRNDNGSILHGTLLYKTDIEQLVRSITPDNDKLISKGIESVRQRVINVGDYMTLGREELMRHLENAVTDGVVSLTEAEFAEVCAMEQEYLSDEWLYGNNPPYTVCNKRRFDFGIMEARIDVKNGVVRGVAFNGDFFTHKELDPLCDALRGMPFERGAIEARLRECRVEEYIMGADAVSVAECMTM